MLWLIYTCLYLCCECYFCAFVRYSLCSGACSLWGLFSFVLIYIGLLSCTSGVEIRVLLLCWQLFVCSIVHVITYIRIKSADLAHPRKRSHSFPCEGSGHKTYSKLGICWFKDSWVTWHGWTGLVSQSDTNNLHERIRTYSVFLIGYWNVHSISYLSTIMQIFI